MEKRKKRFWAMVLAAVIWLVPNAQVWANEPETTTEYSDEPIVYTSGGGSVTPSTYTLTYAPNNTIETNTPISSRLRAQEITFPECEFEAQPGQIFTGWQEADLSKDPVEGKGAIYKPGEKYKLNRSVTFLAIWEDNTTFRIEAADEYVLAPPDNDQAALETLIRKDLKITYYEDGVEPTTTPAPSTAPERTTWDDGSHIPADFLDIAVTPSDAYKQAGSYTVRITYKGLYNRTLEKDAALVITDPNALGEEATFDLGKGLVLHYPSSVPYIGKKWDKALENFVYVEDTSTGEKLKIDRITMKKSKNPGDRKITRIKVKKGKTYNSKKLGGGLTVTIRPCYVWTGNYVSGSAVLDNGSVTSMKITNLLGDELTITKSRKKDPIVTENNAISFADKKYTGTMTFEELGV